MLFDTLFRLAPLKHQLQVPFYLLWHYFTLYNRYILLCFSFSWHSASFVLFLTLPLTSFLSFRLSLFFSVYFRFLFLTQLHSFCSSHSFVPTSSTLFFSHTYTFIFSLLYSIGNLTKKVWCQGKMRWNQSAHVKWKNVKYTQTHIRTNTYLYTYIEKHKFNLKLHSSPLKPFLFRKTQRQKFSKGNEPIMRNMHYFRTDIFRLHPYKSISSWNSSKTNKYLFKHYLSTTKGFS